jgi:Na+/melibiose symporter-like transporter
VDNPTPIILALGFLVTVIVVFLLNVANKSDQKRAVEESNKPRIEELSASLVETQSRSKNETTEYSLLIQAQNRTTHAVRAFVRFLFIQLSALTLATFLFFVSFQLENEEGAPNTFLLVMGGVIWIIGLIWSSSAGWSELEKSNIKE